MSVIVDSSVIIAALIDSGPHGMWAEQVLSGRLLYAPELVRAEAMNVLRRLERTKLITTPEANGATDDLMRLEIVLFSFEPFADRIWELRDNMTSYDAWYVALAEGLRLPLATLDERFSKSNAGFCDFLIPGR